MDTDRQLQDPVAVRRIGIVDDHQVTIAGLQAILAADPGLQVVADAPSVAELLAETEDLDLVILDLRLPDGSSPEDNVDRLHGNGIQVLVFTSGEEPYLVQAAARSGVLGVLRKSERSEVVVAAVHAAAAGDQVATMEWAAAIDADSEFTSVDLPEQQRKVLALYASGETTERVARLTELSPNTVKVYLGRIKDKYADVGRPAGTRTDLDNRALEDGYLPLPKPRAWIRPRRRRQR